MNRLTQEFTIIRNSLLLLVALVVACIAYAENNPRHNQMHKGPYFHQIMSASSKDGLNWTKDNTILIKHASVPSAILTPEGIIRLYYVDATKKPETINCAESRDGGKTFQVLNCTIANRSLDKALDPSIVLLPDGRYRLYYFCSETFIDRNKTHGIYSAISNDGIHFTEEKEVFNRMGAVDPDVFYNGSKWLMYVFSRGTIIATSDDGLNFTYSQQMQPQHWGTTAPVKLPNGMFRLYAFNQPHATYIASFLSSDGIHWQQESGVRLHSPQGRELTDPYVIQLPDGSWKMFYKVESESIGN